MSGLLAAAAIVAVQSGFPQRTTLVDCIVAPPIDSEPSPVQRIAILLHAGGERSADGGGTYDTKGVNMGRVGSSRVAHNWPVHFLIEEFSSLEGIHGERFGRGEVSLRIDRIDERGGQADLTFIANREYDRGRTERWTATGSCRLIGGRVAVRAFEGFVE